MYDEIYSAGFLSLSMSVIKAEYVIYLLCWSFITLLALVQWNQVLNDLNLKTKIIHFGISFFKRRIKTYRLK